MLSFQAASSGFVWFGVASNDRYIYLMSPACIVILQILFVAIHKALRI